MLSDTAITARRQQENPQPDAPGHWLFSMQHSNLFLIESERSRHTLFLNGQEISRFTTLDAAKAEANQLAQRAVPGTTLRFELDFKWTLTDLEIRSATLRHENGKALPCGS